MKTFQSIYYPIILFVIEVTLNTNLSFLRRKDADLIYNDLKAHIENGEIKKR